MNSKTTRHKRMAVAIIMACLSFGTQAPASQFPSNSTAPEKLGATRLCTSIAEKLSARKIEILLDSNTPDSKTPRLIDLNGDGIKESVTLSDGINLSIIRADDSFIPDIADTSGYENHSFQGEVQSLIQYNKSVFVLASGGKLPALFRFGSDLKLRLECVFRQTDSRFKALTPYELFIARSEAQGIDPVTLAIQHQDIRALRLLTNNGHDLNRKPNSDHDSYFNDAIFAVSSTPDGEAFIAAMLDMGANPGKENDKNFPAPIPYAIRKESPSLVKLLIDRGAYIYSPYHNPNREIIQYFKDRNAREDLLLTITKRRKVIDSYVIDHVLDGKASKSFLIDLIKTGLPLEGDEVTWVNGERAVYNPLVMELALAKKDNGDILNFLAGLTRQPPVTGKPIRITFMYETEEKIVFITNGLVILPYSLEVKKEQMNFSTSICLHLIGKECGSDDMKRDATKWLATLPLTCPLGLSKTFDEPVCKLALYWTQKSAYNIFLRDKLKPDPKDKPGSIGALQAFSLLGRKSLVH
jgi:hypothetical protein